MPEPFDESSEVAQPQSSSPLDKAGEFAKYLTALATGALVFSADLLKKDFVLPSISRHLVLASWVLLALSALAGLAALARIPMMMVEKTDDLEDGYLKWPLRGQQVFLMAGILALGTALVLALWHAAPSSATDAQKVEVTCENDASKNDASGERFTILSSAPHMVGNVPAHQHTFLVDRETGHVWEMICDSEKNVRFRAVQVDPTPSDLDEK